MTPMAIPQLLAACEFRLAQPRQIVVVGERGREDTQDLLRVIRTRFIPNRVLLLIDSAETRRALAVGAPAVEAMQPINGRASAYVCRNFACQLPVSEGSALAELLQ